MENVNFLVGSVVYRFSTSVRDLFVDSGVRLLVVWSISCRFYEEHRFFNQYKYNFMYSVHHPSEDQNPKFLIFSCLGILIG